MEIKVKIEDKEVKEALQKLQTKAGNLTPAMADIGELILRSIRINFSME